MAGNRQGHAELHIFNKVATGQRRSAQHRPGESHTGAVEQTGQPQPGQTQRPDQVLEQKSEGRKPLPAVGTRQLIQKVNRLHRTVPLRCGPSLPGRWCGSRDAAQVAEKHAEGL
jgi:hypothetical protein